jgi:hypothetical protein
MLANNKKIPVIGSIKRYGLLNLEKHVLIKYWQPNNYERRTVKLI